MPLRHKNTNLPAGKAGIHKEKKKGTPIPLVFLGALVPLWHEKLVPSTKIKNPN